MIDTETGEILEETNTVEQAQFVLMGYTLAKLALESYEQINQAALSHYHDLQREVEETEAELKTAARLSGSIENESFTVSVVTPMTRWYDVDIILEKAPYVRDLPGVMITSVDKKKIEMLAKAGMIAKEIADLAYREEAGTARVTIKVKTA
jgi:hypothetical protein